jgi:hexosaminidase
MAERAGIRFMSGRLCLQSRYVVSAAGEAVGHFAFSLENTTGKPIASLRLCLQSITRLKADARVVGARFIRRFANLHEFETEAALGVGEVWTFEAYGLTHAPQHACDGPKSAYVTYADGSRAGVECAPLTCPPGLDTGQRKALPDGACPETIGVIPWPSQVATDQLRDGVPRLVGTRLQAEDAAAFEDVRALGQRLFARDVFAGQAGEIALESESFAGAAAAYEISFQTGCVTLRHADAAGRVYGLITLAHIWQGAWETDELGVPETGTIADAPRFGWRGCHVDVVRHFLTFPDLMRLADILAWLKFNVLHVHLTDDEGWRLQIEALPELTQIGAWRGPDEPMTPQYGFSAQRYGGFYTQAEMKELIAQAGRYHVDIMPEIDMPGHSTAALTSLAYLRDPDEPPESYFPIQGFPNNALNPGVIETYRFVETMLEEVCALFPFEYVHIGADEVGPNAWMQSPLAAALRQDEGLADTVAMQGYFLRKVQAMLRARGKRLAGWDEVSHGGGVARDEAVLIAWQDTDKIGDLARAGYDVIASPGQAYYLDMAQASGWSEPGTSWGGTVDFATCYDYEPSKGLSDIGLAHLKGVQACIWSEHLTDIAAFNHMVFPRLAAVAEAGWSDPARKDIARISYLTRLLPRL